MAKGYPDFFGQSVFPHYGALQQIAGDDILIGVATSTLINLEMKGSIQSGNVNWTQMVAGYENAYVFQIWVDGTLVEQVTMDHLQYGYTISAKAMIFRTLVYDEVHPMYECEIAAPITFINSFQLRAQCMSALGSYVAYGQLFYYEIN